ncbi:MAG: SDR family NAD(P)-dependent oxidoreductase [Reyranellaceae bacterium]
MFELDGRVALVTGASTGLGNHFAQVLARQGAAVVVAARRTDKLQELVRSIEATGGKAAAVTMDVVDGKSVREGFKAAEQALGTPDIVVNNAGISKVSAPLETTEEDWDEVVDTNLRGAWLVAQAAARTLVAASKPGRIINIASITGMRAIGHIAAYSAAKAGLLHLTTVLAMEWARYGIQVNAISPGYIETDLNRSFWSTSGGKRLIERVPQKRIGVPSDLDGALLLLASDASRFMTGSNIVVDGGHSSNSM